MSLATTTVYLYIGFDYERCSVGKSLWPSEYGGHIELVDWIETMAVHLEKLYETEFAHLNLGCVFDYEITETLGAWLYHHDDVAAFAMKARKLVAEVQENDTKFLQEILSTQQRIK